MKRIKDRAKVPTTDNPLPTQNKELIKRVPRPAGLTLIAMEMNKEPSTRTDKLRSMLIGQWTNNNMQLNGHFLNTQQLAKYLNMPEEYIMKYMTGTLQKMGKFLDKVDAGEIARALLSHILKKGLEIQAQSQAQVGILMASQGAGYQPFISMAVNQALANLNGTQKPLFDIFKAVQGGPDTVNNNLFINTQTTQDKYLTTDEAIKLIGPTQKSMIEDVSQADAYILTQSNLPNVNARTQDLREIGIKHDGTKTASAGLPEEKAHQLGADRESRIPRFSNIPEEVLNEEDFTS